MLLRHVVEVHAAGGHRVWLRFDDGVEGDVDLAPIIAPFTGVLAPLADPAFVARVRVHPEFGTITWPGDLDLDPVVLHCAVRGVPVPTYDAPPKRRPRRSGRRNARGKRASKAQRSQKART